MKQLIKATTTEKKIILNHEQFKNNIGEQKSGENYGESESGGFAALITRGCHRVTLTSNDDTIRRQRHQVMMAMSSIDDDVIK